MFLTLISVAVGGALGASGRYLTSVAAMRLMGPGFPWGTVVVNVLGSFLIGVLVIVLAETSSNRYAPFLMTGVLGGFTTFSAFSLETVSLWERGAHVAAVAYAGGSVVLGIAALILGLVVARAVWA